MSRNAYIALGAIVILIIGGFLFFGDRAETPTISNGEEAQVELETEIQEEESLTEGEVIEEVALEHEVVYTNQGFSPSEINASVGDTVIFRNQSSRNMWVASDPHPTHSAYPQFDSRRGLPPGEVYQFTFARAGTWGYHDHLFPGAVGTVVVE